MRHVVLKSVYVSVLILMSTEMCASFCDNFGRQVEDFLGENVDLCNCFFDRNHRSSTSVSVITTCTLYCVNSLG